MEDSLLIQFGERLRELRNQRGLSQERLGEIAGLDRTYISGIERGIRNPSLRNIGYLAEALEVSVGRLLKGL